MKSNTLGIEAGRIQGHPQLPSEFKAILGLSETLPQKTKTQTNKTKQLSHEKSRVDAEAQAKKEFMVKLMQS